MLLDVIDNLGHSLVDTTLQIHRIGTGGNILQTLVDDALGEDGSSGGTVAGIITCLRGHALHQLGTCILKLVFQFHFLGHCHTVLGNLGCAKLLLDHHITTFGAEGYLNSISQLVYALLQKVAGIGIELYFFCHDSFSLICLYLI